MTIPEYDRIKPKQRHAYLIALQSTKHHPASVDLELVKRLITTTKTSTLKAFLSKEFSSISKDYAGHH